MNEKILAHLTAHCQKKGWEINDNVLMEVLTEAKHVYTEIGSSHRWYDEEFNVVEVDGMLIGYDGFHVTGDTSISDMGLEYDLRTICEVEKKQKTVDYYVKK